MWSFYIPSMVCVVLACIYLLRRYAAPTVHWFAKLLVLAGWLTSISIVALVPIDVWSTLKHTQNKSINVMWSISYWSTQILTWVMIPLSQGFFDAGDFTFLKRLRQAVKDRLVYFSSLGIVAFFVVGFLLLTRRLAFKDLLPYAMVLSNTYGLVAGILLLGYGIVAIPRHLWQHADPEAGYRWALYRIGQTADKLEAEALEIQRVATVVEATSKSMSTRDPLRPYMELIYHQAELESPIKPSQAVRDQRGRVNLDELTERDLDYGTEERGLAKLRRRLTRVVYNFNGLRSKYEVAVGEGLSLEAVCKARKNKDFFLPQGDSSVAVTMAQGWMVFQCHFWPWLQRGIALFLAANSFMLVWSEATIGSGTNPDLSPFSHMIGHGAHGEVATQLLTGLPLAFMCGCSYYSLFKLVIFSYYQMVPYATDPVSLLLNAGQVCRFAAPLAYNFMHVIRMNEKTVFAIKMGSAMDQTLPFFGADFNTWFPLTVVIYCLLLYLNIWDTVAGICLPKRFRFSEESAHDEHTERGRHLLRQEQDAKGLGLPVGECLGLWGSVEAPGISLVTQQRARAGAGKGPAAEAPALYPAQQSASTSSSKGEQPIGNQGTQAQPSTSAWIWSQRARPGSEASTPPPSKPSSRRASQSGGSKAGHSRVNSSSHLDDIFARLEPGDDGSNKLGRIDDEATPLSSLEWTAAPSPESPRTAWNRVWR